MNTGDGALRGDSLAEDPVRKPFLDYICNCKSSVLYDYRPFILLQAAELHIYTDFLRLVLEILNAILTYALPRNPEVLTLFIPMCILFLWLCQIPVLILDCYFQVVYAIMHKQEVFLPFKNHPRFNELLENIYSVCIECFPLHKKCSSILLLICKLYYPWWK